MDQLISKAVENAKRVVAGVKPSQFDDATPCSEFNVKQLANHMAILLIGSERAAMKQEPMAPPDPMPDIVGDNPGAAYSGLADKAVAAWSSTGALDGNTQFGPGDIPAQMAAAITLMEIAVHGWDLAKATGQSYSLDEDVAAATFETVKQLNANGRSPAFGPEVSGGESASTQDQMLAYSGRNTNWNA